MVTLQKLWIAHFIGKDKHPFMHQKIVAESLSHATEIAEDWAEVKYPNRVRDIVIERSKGEVVTDANH